MPIFSVDWITVACHMTAEGACPGPWTSFLLNLEFSLELDTMTTSAPVTYNAAFLTNNFNCVSSRVFYSKEKN